MNIAWGFSLAEPRQMCEIPLTGSVPFSHLFYSSVLTSFHPYIHCLLLPPSTSHPLFSFTPLFTHLCSSALFLFHLPSLSLPLEFLWCGQESEEQTKLWIEDAGKGWTQAFMHTHRYTVWLFEHASVSRCSRSWCSLPFCPGGTSCDNPGQNGNAKLNPYHHFWSRFRLAAKDLDEDQGDIADGSVAQFS